MRYSGWIDFPSFSIAISQGENGFRCQKFVNNSIVRDATKDCQTVSLVKDFLLGFSNPPTEQIEILIAALKLKHE